MGLPATEDAGDPHGITSRFLMQELPQGTTKEDLEHYFSTFGEIEEASVRVLAKGGVQGSVKFANPTMELRNMMLREQHVIQGSAILVQTWKMHKMARGQAGPPGLGTEDPYGKGKGKPGKAWDPYSGGKGGADSCAKGKSGKEPWDPYGGAKGKDPWDPYGGAKGQDPWDPYGKGKSGKDPWDPYGCGKGGADGYSKGKPSQEWDPYGSCKGGADASAKGKPSTDLGPYGGGKGGPDGCAKGKPSTDLVPYGGGKGGLDGCAKGKSDWDPYGYGKAGPDSYGKGKDPYGGCKGWGYEDAGWASKGYDGYGYYGGYGGYGAYGPPPSAGVYGYGDYGAWGGGGGYKGDPGKSAGWGACGKGWPASSSASGCKGGKDDGKNKDITTRYLISDLPEGVTEDELRTYFAVFAQIEEVTCRKIESNGKIMGSVKFVTPTVELRDQMLKETHEIHGQQMQVQTWKMQKMSKPGYAAKKEAESAKYFAQKQGFKGKGKGLVPGGKPY